MSTQPQRQYSTTASERTARRQRRTAEAEEHEEVDETVDPLANLLSLQLRKPPHWNWELSTSRSCSNIALPRILLYDHTGALLLDADGQSEQTYRPATSTSDRRRKRAATSNLAQAIRQTATQLPSEFHGLQIGEATPSVSPARSQSRSPMRQQVAGSCIDFSTHELPDWQPLESSSSRRSSSLRGVRFEDEPEPRQRVQELAYPTPPSTSTLTTTANSSSSGPREKRRYRRSHSSGQRSILERFSMSRGRHSSPEYVQEQQLEHAPRYFLRTSKAGTLVIQDESFSRVRQRRRRPRHSSSENVLLSMAERSPAESVVQVTSLSRRRQRDRDRERERERERVTVLSTSEEEAQMQTQAQAQTQDNGQNTRPSRCRRNQRNCGKSASSQELITVDPGNCVYRPSSGATAR